MNDALKTEITQTLPLLHGWCQLEKALHLASLIVDTKHIKAVVEVGVFGGQSLIPMALAMRHRGLKNFAFGIDPWEVDAAVEGEVGKENADWWSNKVNLEEIYASFVKTVLDLKLTYHCAWLRMRGEAAVEMFPDGCVTVFHLDSNHSEMASCRDVDLWVPKVEQGGYLVFDDSNWISQSKAYRMLSERLQLIGDYPNGPGQQYSVFRKP